MEGKTECVGMDKLCWLELNTLCTQTEEAALEVQKVIDGFSAQSVSAVINASYAEGKTLSICRTIPAHHVVTQGLLNMDPVAIKKLYAIATSIPENSKLKLCEVVTKSMNPQLLKMTVTEFKRTVELLFYLKEYFISVFGMGLINLTCQDKVDVVLILSQVTMSCNLCDRPASSTRLFQCLECSVSSVCVECLKTDKGQEYLESHGETCNRIQDLIRPYIDSLKYAHLCKQCFIPLHRNVTKSHFQPDVFFSKKRVINITCGRAKCTVPKCRRDLCQTCLLKHKK
jgi:hypothetical protein